MKLAVCVRSMTREYDPLDTPAGNPGSVPGVTATPAVPVNGVAVQQWMCATVVVPLRPDHALWIDNVSASSSNTSVTKPVPVAPGASGPRLEW